MMENDLKKASPVIGFAFFLFPNYVVRPQWRIFRGLLGLLIIVLFSLLNTVVRNGLLPFRFFLFRLCF